MVERRAIADPKWVSRFLDKKVGGGISYAVPPPLKSWGGGGGRPPPIDAHGRESTKMFCHQEGFQK